MKQIQKITALLLCLALALVAVGCSKTPSTEELWANALYTENQAFGDGATTVQVEVSAGERSVTFTFRTDEALLGDALLAHEILVGEEGPYGLFFEEVNGITASFDKHGAYWAFYKDGEYMNVGVDGAMLAEGDHYELVYTVD